MFKHITLLYQNFYQVTITIITITYLIENTYKQLKHKFEKKLLKTYFNKLFKKEL